MGRAPPLSRRGLWVNPQTRGEMPPWAWRDESFPEEYEGQGSLVNPSLPVQSNPAGLWPLKSIRPAEACDPCGFNFAASLRLTGRRQPGAVIRNPARRRVRRPGRQSRILAVKGFAALEGPGRILGRRSRTPVLVSEGEQALERYGGSQPMGGL